MVKKYFKGLELIKVILSRGRAEAISTHKLVENVVLVVPRSEFNDYKKTTKLPKIVKAPDDIHGAGPVRNWILRHFKEKVVVMFDDDITHMTVATHEHCCRISDPEIIDTVIETTAVCAMDAGCKFFGFDQKGGDVRKFKNNKPFILNGYAGGVMGFIGRDLYLDENVRLHDDADFGLQQMLINRIIWKDDRFGFAQKRFCNSGGNSLYRTKAANDQEMKYLRVKWGDHIRFKKAKHAITTHTIVDRRGHPDKIN